MDTDLVDLFKLCAVFSWSKYRSSRELRFIQDRVNALLSRDYKIAIIENKFCSTYPLEIILIGGLHLEDEEERRSNKEILESINAHETEAKRLEKLMEQSRLCRCRQRIPSPVIFVRGKSICRSAALSETLEWVYQTGEFSSLAGQAKRQVRAAKTALDIEWLKKLRIKYIVDFMVEDTKSILTLRFSSGENTSSEYKKSGFGVNKLPFPGVEAFYKFMDQARSGHKLPSPDWSRISAALALCHPHQLPDPYEWKDYTSWDTIELTQNYVRYIMSLIRDNDNPDHGILMHCISGWDRTPAFISIVRLLLWAEGEAHQSLSVDQMLYLTVGYDWLLFGHQFVKRMSKKHEIMFFTFYVLQHLLPDEYSLAFGPPPLPAAPDTDDEETNWVVLEESTGGVKSQHSPEKEKRSNPNDISSSAHEEITTKSTDSPATALREPDDGDELLPSPAISSVRAQEESEPANTNAAPSSSSSTSDGSTKLDSTSTDDKAPSVAATEEKEPEAKKPKKKVKQSRRTAAKPSTGEESATPSSSNTPPTSPGWRRSKLATSLDELRQIRKQRLFELSSKFLQLYADHIEPVFRKKR